MRARGMRALDSHITCAGSGSLKFTSLEVAGRVGTSTTKSRRKSRQSSCEYASAGFSARPYPGNVGAYTSLGQSFHITGVLSLQACYADGRVAPTSLTGEGDKHVV